MNGDDYFEQHKSFGRLTADYNDKNIAKMIEEHQGEELAKMDLPYEQALAVAVLVWKMRRHAKECDGC